MFNDRTRTGGRPIHHSGSINSRTSSVQIYAGTVPQKHIVTSQPVRVSSTNWVPTIIIGLVVLAVAIIGITLLSLSSSRKQAQRTAEAVAAMEQARASVANQWTQTLGPSCLDMSTRAATAAGRLGQLLARVSSAPEPQRSSLLAETTGQATQGITLTNNLAKCHAIGTNLLVQTAAAASMDAVVVQRLKMERLAESLTGFESYMPKFETALANLDARITKALSTASSPIPAPPAPSPPPSTTAALPPIVPPERQTSPLPPADASVTLPCIADATVRDGEPNANYGADPTLSVKLDADGYIRVAYLMFDIADVPGMVVSGKLRAKALKSGRAGASVAVLECSDLNWTETGADAITWNRRTSSTGPALATASVPANVADGTAFEWDLTSHLRQLQRNGRAALTLVLKSTQSGSETYADFASKDAGSGGPELVLAYSTAEAKPPVVAGTQAPRAGALSSAEAAYARALTNLAFAAVAKDARDRLAKDGPSLAKEQRVRLEILAERAELLAQLKAHVIARLSQTPLPQGWIQTTPPTDILAADDAGLTLRGQVVPWHQVPPRQIVHLANQTVPNAALTAPRKARLMLAAALYCIEQGQADLGLRYRAQAVQGDASLQTTADRLLPDMQQVRMKAADATLARSRDELAATEATMATLRDNLLGDVVRGSIPLAFYKDIPGTSPKDLRDSKNFPDSPDSRIALTKLQLDKGLGESYGALATGVLLPPKTGEYRFYVVVDDAAEVWLGTGPNADTKRRLVYVSKHVSDDNWLAREDQKSEPVALQANRPYYLEVLFCQGGGIDRLRVGWKIPGENDIKVIDGKYLATLSSSTSPESSLSERVSQNAWVLLDEANGHMVAAHNALTEAENAYAAATVAEAQGATEAALKSAATAILKAQEAARKVEPVLAKIRPLVQQVVQFRQNKRL